MRLLTSGLIIILLALALFLLWVPENSQIDSVTEYQQQEKPIILQNPDMTDFENDRLTIRIQAKSAHLFENKKLTLLFDVDGILYPEAENRNPTRIKADFGTVKGKSQFITLKGNVRVDFGDGQKLFTQKINLDRKKELLYNKVDVSVTSEDHRVHAKRMKYDMKTGVLVLTRPKAWIDAGEL